MALASPTSTPENSSEPNLEKDGEERGQKQPGDKQDMLEQMREMRFEVGNTKVGKLVAELDFIDDDADALLVLLHAAHHKGGNIPGYPPPRHLLIKLRSSATSTVETHRARAIESILDAVYHTLEKPINHSTELCTRHDRKCFLLMVEDFNQKLKDKGICPRPKPGSSVIKVDDLIDVGFKVLNGPSRLRAQRHRRPGNCSYAPQGLHEVES
ncbi:uncharacterized protein PAC_02982 [Phialocephala subalpina]|uniref:Uncharacterized protein n=1 Tax=Phialocephala subalpina TaxID=576137 RepID=A0A1L7WJZ8_9HELO|nr:uncharacterized protein PAC_02982 [Phialocephala subalpina]